MVSACSPICLRRLSPQVRRSSSRCIISLASRCRQQRRHHRRRQPLRRRRRVTKSAPKTAKIKRRALEIVSTGLPFGQMSFCAGVMVTFGRPLRSGLLALVVVRNSNISTNNQRSSKRANISAALTRPLQQLLGQALVATILRPPLAPKIAPMAIVWRLLRRRLLQPPRQQQILGQAVLLQAAHLGTEPRPLRRCIGRDFAKQTAITDSNRITK